MSFIVEWRNPDRTVAGRVAYEKLRVVPRFNRIGAWQVEFPSTAEATEWVGPGGGIVIQDADERQIMSGPLVTLNTKADDKKAGSMITMVGVDDSALPSWRVVRPTPLAAVTAQTDSHYIITGPTETVIRQIVNVNAGPGALAARRVAGLVLGAVGTPGGIAVTTNIRFKRLGEVISALAEAAGFGWDVQWDRATRNLVFAVYAPLDVSDTVRFSRDAATLPGYEYVIDAPTLTAPVLLGQGEGTARTAVEVVDTAAENRWGFRIEDVLDRRDTGDGDEYLQEIAEQLAERGETVSFDMTALDTPDMRYGVAYGPGSLVTVDTPTGSFVDVVREVIIEHEAGSSPTYEVVVGSAGASADRDSILFTIVDTLFRRVRKLEVI